MAWKRDFCIDHDALKIEKIPRPFLRGFAIRGTGVHRYIISESPDILFIESTSRWGGKPGLWRKVRARASDIKHPRSLSSDVTLLRYAIPMHMGNKYLSAVYTVILERRDISTARWKRRKRVRDMYVIHLLRWNHFIISNHINNS